MHLFDKIDLSGRLSDEEYETRLYDYHGRPVYWDSSDRPAGTPSRDETPQHHA